MTQGDKFLENYVLPAIQAAQKNSEAKSDSIRIFFTQPSYAALCAQVAELEEENKGLRRCRSETQAAADAMLSAAQEKDALQASAQLTRMRRGCESRLKKNWRGNRGSLKQTPSPWTGSG